MYRLQVGGYVNYSNNLSYLIDWGYEVFQTLSDYEILKLLEDYDDAMQEFKKLLITNSKNLVSKKYIFRDTTGLVTADLFMKFRLLRGVSGKTIPLSGLRNKKRFTIVINKCLRLNKETNITFNSLINTSGIASGSQKLSNFLPSVAKGIYDYYCGKDNANILDMSAGFGGRLTGAMASKHNYFYTGVDPATETFQNLQKLAKFLNVQNRVRLINKPFEDCDSDLEDESFDIMFTSPPYFAKEKYSDEDTQSWKRYPNFSDWVKGFLKRSFEIVYKKLKKNAYMIINIANVKIEGKMYDLENATIQSALDIGFKYIQRKEMVMTSTPGTGRRYKTEPVFVFQKL
jgi:16S rRNA G966 N2-methylase RsmD